MKKFIYMFFALISISAIGQITPKQLLLKNIVDSINRANKFKSQLKSLISESLIDSSYQYIFSSPSDSFLLEKNYYYYNGNGYDTLIASYLMDNTTHNWVYDGKCELLYNSKGSITSQAGFNWNSTTNQFIVNYKYEYAYNVNGTDTSESIYNNLPPTYQLLDESYYNANGMPLRQFDYTYIWDTTTKQWDINSVKTEYQYSYNSNNNDTIQLCNVWDSIAKQWLPHDKGVFFYNSNGLDTLYVDSLYSTRSKTNYVIYSKTVRYYNSNGKDTLIELYNWDSNTNQWTAIQKFEYAYNASGTDTSETYYNFQSVQKEYYSFNSKGMPTGYFDYKWNATTNQWVCNSKLEYTYSNGNNIMQTSYNLNDSTNQFEIIGRIYNYFALYNVNSINPIKDFNALIIYPNPTSGILNINSQNLVKIGSVQYGRHECGLILRFFN